MIGNRASGSGIRIRIAYLSFQIIFFSVISSDRLLAILESCRLGPDEGKVFDMGVEKCENNPHKCVSQKYEYSCQDAI